MRKLRIFGVTAVAVAGVAAAGLAALTTSSCGSTPPNIVVRSFQQARDVDYLCIQFADPTGMPLDPTMSPGNPGLNANQCSLVPPNANGQLLPNHMLALVTQAARGEVAVVDLTGNYIVDESKIAPGTNFIPVGSQPTGIVVAPDAKMTFVASADINKPAIYGIPTNSHTVSGRTVGGVLGDSTQSVYSDKVAPLTLVDLPACALPQPPQTISVAHVPPGQGAPPDGYVIVATLQQSGASPAAVVTIDPRGLVLGGTLDPGAGVGTDGGSPPAVTPGVLEACPILGATRLSDATDGGGTTVPWSPGPAWADGVPYADAGDLSAAEPGLGASCTAASPAFTLPSTLSARPFPAHAVMRDDAPLLYVADAELPEIHVIDVGDPAHPVEQAPLLATSVTQHPQQSLLDAGTTSAQPVSVGAIALSPVTREYKRFLYAIDNSDGSVMVYDVTDPVASPHTPLLRPHAELDPLSLRDRIAFAAPVASLAFATHDWPIIPPSPNSDQVHAYAGLLCNPNPNAVIDGGAVAGGEAGVRDYGFYYTAQQTGVPYSGGTEQAIPLRLRGVFAFATLTTGEVITIDVDDWDAPCRRPDPMATPEAGAEFKMTVGMTGVLALPQSEPGPPGSPTFLDPYSAPFPEGVPGEPSSQASSVTQESFFPVSAPHRMRSMFLLRNDPMVGNNAPNVLSPPALTDVSGASVAAANGSVPALILPTTLPAGFIDPSLVTNPAGPLSGQQLLDAGTEPAKVNTPGVRLSFDDPTVALNQVWSVTYEGALPTLTSVAADILAPGADAGPDASGAYATLTFSIGQGIPGAEAGAPLPGVGPGFCERGVEDWDLGRARAQQALDAMAAGGLPAPPQLEAWTADYVEIVDDPLAQGDPYWNVPNACWEGLSTGKGSNRHDLSPHPDSKSGKDSQTLADERYNVCNQVFGTGAPDSYLARDLPILRAYDDHLDVGRFAWPTPDTGPIPELTTNRTIVGPDPSNGTELRFVACCFHDQASFKVRAGGEWLATGQTTGLLHHVVASSTSETDPISGGAGSRRCVQSCDPHDVLLNSRSVDVPWAPIPWNKVSPGGDAGAGEGLDAGREGGIGDAGSDAGSGLVCTFPRSAAPIDRNSVLALRNPFFSYVTWMACLVPTSPYDHTVTLRDDAWHFQLAGGFAPLTTSLTANSILDISPQSMRYIQPLGWMAVIDGQSQGLQIIDLDNPASVARVYF